MSAAVIPIESYDEFMKLLASGASFIVDFWAEWCGPCKFISPIYERTAKATLAEQQNLKFYSVDVDAQPQISAELNIRAMPTFMSFKGGEKVNEVIGADPAILAELISSSAENA